MGCENVISECVAKVRSMYEEQDVLTAEAQRQVNDLNARVQRGEQQVAHVFGKYEHLSQQDRLEYIALENPVQHVPYRKCAAVCN